MSASDSTLELPAAAAAAPPVERPSHGQRKKPPQRRVAAPPPLPRTAPRPPRPAAAPVEADDDRNASSWSAQQFIGAVPGWLVSLVVHLLLVIFLALLTIAPPKVRQATVIAVTPIRDEPPLVESLEFVKQTLEVPQSISTSISAADLTMTAVGDLGSAVPTTSALASGDLDLPAGAEIGDIFTRGGGMLSSAASGVQGAQFFGVKATGRRFVFVVDSSNSMRNGKFDAAKEELSYAIRRLSKDQFFYVIFFDHDAARMTFAPNSQPEEFTVAATNENIGKFEKWMATVENELRTDPYDAMKFALEMRPDAIYILSDGKFTDRGQTVRYLAAENVLNDPVTGRMPRVVIHTVAFWQLDGEEQMKEIAKDYAGTYRFVPPPKGKKK